MKQFTLFLIKVGRNAESLSDAGRCLCCGADVGLQCVDGGYGRIRGWHTVNKEDGMQYGADSMLWPRGKVRIESITPATTDGCNRGNGFKEGVWALSLLDIGIKRVFALCPTLH